MCCWTALFSLHRDDSNQRAESSRVVRWPICIDLKMSAQFLGTTTTNSSYRVNKRKKCERWSLCCCQSSSLCGGTQCSAGGRGDLHHHIVVVVVVVFHLTRKEEGGRESSSSLRWSRHAYHIKSNRPSGERRERVK